MKTRLVLYLAALLMTAQSGQSDATTNREITVRLHFRTSEGQPGPAWRFAIQTSQGLFGELTDAEGKAVFHPTVSADEQAAWLIFDPTPVDNKLQREERERIERMLAFMQNYYLPNLDVRQLRQRMVIEPGRNEYMIDLVALPSIVVSARLVSDGPEPSELRSLAFARFATDVGYGLADGTLRFSSIAKGIDNELFISNSPALVNLHLSADDTKNDMQLGQVRLPQYPAGPVGMCRIVGSGFETMALIGRRPIVGVTLLSDDGMRILSYFMGDRGQMYYEYNRQDEAFAVPIGTYYVAPELFRATKLQLGLLDAIRAKVNLDESHMPKLVVKENELVEFSFDAGKVADAISKVMVRMEEDKRAAQERVKPKTEQPAPPRDQP